MVQYLQYINVVYTDTADAKPCTAIQEVDSANADINAGYGGKFVWLEAIWTSDPFECATSIDVQIQAEENPGWQDMAKGAGGAYRYLIITNDQGLNYRVTKVGLWRTKDADSKPSKQGWKNWTPDINKGRGGDYLYICWETTDVY